MTDSPASTAALEAIRAASALGGPDQAVGFWIWRVSLAYQRRAEAALQALDLTHLQFLMLVLTGWLGATAPPVRQRDLVAISGVAEAQVSLMIKALKAKGLVVQRAGEEDTRVRLIGVTAKGARVLAQAVPVMGALQEALWPEAGEKERLLAILHDAVARWDGDLRPGALPLDPAKG